MDDATQDEKVTETENTEEPTNDEVIEDTDADTKDVTDTVNTESAEIYKRINDFFARLDSIDARLDALSNAQAVMLENGLTVREVADDSNYESDRKDEFVPLDELDFTI